MANAMSFVCRGWMPMISAAMSMSRMAIQARPMRPRTMFLAASAKTVRKTRLMKYRVSAVALGPVTMMPRKVRGGAVIVPDGLSL